MKKIVLATIIVLLGVSTTAFTTSSGGQKVKVKWIYDGDTVLVSSDTQDKIKVRIIGIDCPESHNNDKCKRDGQNGRKGCNWQIPRGKKAKKRAIQLLKNKSVTLECDGKCKSGSYGRKLRYIRIPDGRDFGLQLIKEGLCEDFSWKYPHAKQKEYRKAQKSAQKKKNGIWN